MIKSLFFLFSIIATTIATTNGYANDSESAYAYNCTLYFGNGSMNYYSKAFSRSQREKGLFIKIGGLLSYFGSTIKSINTFECNDTTSTKKKCAELEKLINDIRYNNKKVTLDQLDNILKK